MKKIRFIVLIFILSFALVGCDEIGLLSTIDNQTSEIETQVTTNQVATTTDLPGIEDRIIIGENNGCINDDYIMVNDQCVLIETLLSPQVEITESEVIVTSENNTTVLDGLIADLSGSQGLAIISKDVFNKQSDLTVEKKLEVMRLSSNMELTADNIIVKLVEEGFFEEVSFSDSSGLEVNIEANPLALEVFGDFTVVIFDVNFGSMNDTRTFDQKVQDSLWSGGAYLIHNETGKVFPSKIVDFEENTWIETIDTSYTINVMATLNEPLTRTVEVALLDEDDNPVLDEFGEVVYEEVQEIILDEFGNEIIYTEGPIVTETQSIAATQTVLVLLVDEDDNPILDNQGEPIYEEVTEFVYDDDGNQVFYTEEVAVLDEFGNIVYETNFEVEVLVNETTEYEHIEYYARIEDGPLNHIISRMVEKTIDRYYEWNYYRDFEYHFQYDFIVLDDYIYYLDNILNDDDESELIIKKLSFDSMSNEIVIEEFLNLSKAGLEQSEIIANPASDLLVLLSYEGNMKVFSPTLGLRTIEDSSGFRPVVFPTGDLFFFKDQSQYVESLGYYTHTLYKIDQNMNFIPYYVETNEIEQIYESNGQDDYWGYPIDVYDENGIFVEGNQVSTLLIDGGYMIHSADVNIISKGTFNSERSMCDNPMGCNGETEYMVYNGDDFIGSFTSYVQYFPDQTPPPFQVSIQINSDVEISYNYEISSEDMICDNDTIGCKDNFFFIDNNDDFSIEFYKEKIAVLDEKLIESIRVLDENQGIYDYTKHYTSEVCQFDQCYEWIKVYIYDADGEIIQEGDINIAITKDQQIPLFIEYRMTETTEYQSSGVCTSSNGCEGYLDFDSQSMYVHYNQNDIIYTNIEFLATDITKIYEHTFEREICTNLGGCSTNDITYYINDLDGNLVYEIHEEFGFADYGERLPYTVTLTIDDVEIFYDKVYTDIINVCDNPYCTEYVSFIDEDGQYLGSMNVTFLQGEQLYSQVDLLSTNEPYDIITDKHCLSEDGCYFHTEDFILLDEDGNQMTVNSDYAIYMPVRFAYGEVMPYDYQLQMTYQLSNVEYERYRIDSFNIIYNIGTSVKLDDNMFFIKGPSWEQNYTNYILEYDSINQSYIARTTNLPNMTELYQLGDGYIGINKDKTSILYVEVNSLLSTEVNVYFEIDDLTEDYQINAIDNLIIDYDGTIYFVGVDNFIQDITGTILPDKSIIIDTVYTEHEIIRLSPINWKPADSFRNLININLKVSL